MAANKKTTSLLPKTDGTFDPMVVEERFAGMSDADLAAMSGRGGSAAARGDTAAMNESLAAGQESRARMGASNQGMTPTPTGFGQTTEQRQQAAQAAQPTEPARSRTAVADMPYLRVTDLKSPDMAPVPSQQQAMPETTPGTTQRQLGAPGTGGEFAMARGARAPVQGMQGTTPASERIENQPNLYERMQENPFDERLQKQFDALPENAKRAQIARAEANATNARAGMRIVNPGREAQRAFNQPAEARQQPRAGEIIGDPRVGSLVVGSAGAQMQFVEDPMNPQAGALPVSAGMTQEEYVANISPQQRQSIRQMLIEQGGAAGKQLQKIDDAREQMRSSENMRNRDNTPRAYVGQEERRLQQLEDSVIYGQMRDPDALVSARKRSASEKQAAQEQADRQSIAVQERLERQRQQQAARVYADAYKRAQTELQTDPYKPVQDSQIRARAQELFNQQMAASGMATPARGQAGGGFAPSQPPSGAPTAGAAPPSRVPQSGAPDSGMMGDIAIDPGSPIDFQQLPNGNLVALIPNEVDPANPIPMRALNLNGRAVAVPSSPAELDMLPAGTMYILEGAYSRGEMREPKRKEGDVPAMSSVAKESPEEQEFAIQQEAKKRAEPRLKAMQDYEEQQAEYTNMLQEAEARAAKELNIPLGAGGQYAWQSLERTGTGERSAGIDAQGQWQDAVNKQLVALAAERYPVGGKQSPEWISKLGDQVVSVREPKAPSFGEDAAAQEIAQARRDYFAKRGTTEFRVRNERLLNEAKTGYTVSIRGGRPSVRVGAREYPGVRVSEGGAQAVLPMVESRGVDPKQIAASALALMTSGKPFAIDIGGRSVPFKFDRNDPRIKMMMEEPNKQITIGSKMAGNNAGVKAATSYINDVFGYLPVAARQEMLMRMLTNPNLGGFSLASD
jgi:hypothetical protein